MAKQLNKRPEGKSGQKARKKKKGFFRSVFGWIVHFFRSIKKDFRSQSGRWRIVIGCFAFMILWLFYNLVNLQVVQSANKSDAQADQLYVEKEITAQRGNIYDRNKNVLVQDSSAKSVSIIPYDVREGEEESLLSVLVEKLGVDEESTRKKITKLEDDIVQVKEDIAEDKANRIIKEGGDAFSYKNGSLYVIPADVDDPKKAAKALVDVLEMSQKSAEGYVTRLENSPIEVANKVDNLLAEEIQKSQTKVDEDGYESTNGVELLEDKMRYYANGNFASQLLGFTGDSHHGLMGVEATYDDLLSGTSGVVLYQKDSNGKTIASQTKVIQEAKAGEDLTLTIDSNIQIEAEKQLSQAVAEWKAISGTAIVMDCKTGEILAMATEPDFDLNEPYTIDANWLATHQSSVAGKSKQEQYEMMWKNQAVGMVYEPGSTFKPITASTALEEGAIEPDATFYCPGYINVNGVRINCTGVHGEQSIAQVLENSCNPGLVQIIQNLDPVTFYRYVYDFGFGAQTGIDLIGEEEGIVNRLKIDEDGDFNMVDYSTYSFGQGLAVTPIQILSALNCLVNDGQYVVPHINLEAETESPRQVVSKKTSDVMKSDLEKVVTGNVSRAKQAEGYSIGGKSGTAQKFVNGEYSTTQYVTSYFSFAPVNDPQYCVLVLLDEPESSALGSTSAGPASIAILEQVLNYNGINGSEEEAPAVTVPDLTGYERDAAKSLLDAQGISSTFTQQENTSGDYVISQSLAPDTVYKEGDVVEITLGDQPEGQSETVPNFKGMSVQAVNEKVSALGMKLKIEGSGFATEQSVSPGTPVEKDMEITVEFN